MAGTIVEPTKTNHDEITSDLSAAAGPAAEERQGGDQEDRRTGIQMERGKGRGGDDSGRGVPSRRITVAHLPCCHTKRVPFALASRTEVFFFLPSQLRWYPGEGWSDGRLDGERGR